MPIELGTLAYTKINDKESIGNNPNIILNYLMQPSFIQKEFNKNWNKLAYTDIKYEHIICINNDPSKSKINNKFYRKIDINGNNLILREIVKDNKIFYDNLEILKLSELIIDYIQNVNDICIISVSFDNLDDEYSSITHGTGYKQLESAEFAPYNFYGNWFVYYNYYQSDDSYPFGESSTYMTNPDINYLYEYKLKKDINVFSIDDDDYKYNWTSYILIYIMFFDICIGSYKYNLIYDVNDYSIDYHEYPNKTLLFRDTYSVRVGQAKIIDKYNYTVYKNNLDLSLPSVPFSDNWINIKGTDGDGDKPLAAKLCELTNEGTTEHLKISGWFINDKKHLMLCNPKEVLSNKGVYLVLPQDKFKNSMQIFIDAINQYKISNNITDDLLKIDEKNTIQYLYVNRSYYKKFNEDYGNDLTILRNNILLLVPNYLPDVNLVKTELIAKYSTTIVEDLIVSYYITEIKNKKKNYDLKQFNFKNYYNEISDSFINLFNILMDTTYNLPMPVSDDPVIIKEYVKNNILNNNLIQNILLVVFKYTLYIILTISLNLQKITLDEKNNILNNKNMFVFNDKDDNYFYNKLLYKFCEYLYRLNTELKNKLTIDTNYLSNIDKDYLQIGGIYKQKYLKYKQKYLELKKLL